MIQTDPAAAPSFLLSWAAILLFIGAPWIFILLLVPVPDVPDEFQEKMEAFKHRSNFDTILIGDSRVLRISEDQFAPRNWKFFNMAFSGLSPEDVEMSLDLALARRPIRRAIIGVSFENMTESFPFEFSSFRAHYEKEQVSAAMNIHHFDDPNMGGESIGLMGKATNLIANRQFQKLVNKVVAKATFFLDDPVRRASSRLHMLLSILSIKSLPPVFLPDGSAAYTNIQKDKNGRYDFRPNHDVGHHWERPDSEARYIERGTLSESAKDVYRRIFSVLKQSGIPAVVFETGRIPAYQQRIDSDPLLHRLQSEWRTFYRDQQSACLRFLDISMLEGVYDPSDFLDATHPIGPTADRLAAKVATELSYVQSGCFSMVGGRPLAAVGE